MLLLCQACKWGYKPDELSVCRRCMEPLPMYDWFYLGFMALLSFVLHCVAIDVNTNRKRWVTYHSLALDDNHFNFIDNYVIEEQSRYLYNNSDIYIIFSKHLYIIYQNMVNFIMRSLCSKSAVWLREFETFKRTCNCFKITPPWSTCRPSE